MLRKQQKISANLVLKLIKIKKKHFKNFFEENKKKKLQLQQRLIEK